MLNWHETQQALVQVSEAEQLALRNLLAADQVVDDFPRMHADLMSAHTVAWTLARAHSEQVGKIAESLYSQSTPSVRAAGVRILARQKAHRRATPRT